MINFAGLCVCFIVFSSGCFNTKQNAAGRLLVWQTRNGTMPGHMINLRIIAESVQKPPLQSKRFASSKNILLQLDNGGESSVNQIRQRIRAAGRAPTGGAIR